MKIVTIYFKGGAQVTIRCKSIEVVGNYKLKIEDCTPAIEMYSPDDIACIVSTDESNGPYT